MAPSGSLEDELEVVLVDLVDVLVEVEVVLVDGERKPNTCSIRSFLCCSAVKQVKEDKTRIVLHIAGVLV